MSHYYAEINIYDSLSTVNPEFVWVLENLESPGILSGHFPRVEKDYRSWNGLKWNLKSWKNQSKSSEKSSKFNTENERKPGKWFIFV